MKNGFIIPDPLEPDTVACVAFKIPNDPLYRQAVRGHIWELAKWFNWEQTVTGDTRATQVAKLFQALLLDTLQVSDDCLGTVEHLLPEDEIEKIEAIKGILPEGYIVTTTEEICAGVMCAIEKLAQRILLASTPDNIENDIGVAKATGEITIKKSSINQPSNEFDTAIEDQIYGGCMAVGEGFRDIVAEIILRKDTQGKTAEAIADILRRTYFFRGLVDAVDLLVGALGDAYDQATNIVTPTVVPQSVANVIYCNGTSKQSLYKWVQQLEDAGSTDIVDIANWYRLLIDELEEDQVQQWFDIGFETTPRLGYTSAPCYRYPSEEFIMTHANWSNSSKIWITNGASHRRLRMELTVVQPFLDASGKKFDGVYVVPVGGSPSASNAIRVYNPPAQTAADAYPAYLGGSGKYVMEFSAPNAITGTVFYPTISFTPVSGEIRIKIYDLGAY